MSAPLTVPEVTPRPQHLYLDTAAGRIRVTRWPGGHRRRDVFRVMADGALVELGHVTGVGRSLLAVPALEGAPMRGCDTYVAGARMLADMLEVSTLQVYTLQVRTQAKEGRHALEETD